MKFRTTEPDFGATGQFELTGVFLVDKQADAAFSTTLGMDRIKTLLLLGAGPAHLQLLDELARNRRSDLDVTLIAPQRCYTHAPCVPGYVAGQHRLQDCQIDLQPLLDAAGARWISARCAGLDAATHSIMLDYGDSVQNPPAYPPGNAVAAAGISRPAIMTYDYLSVDTGSAMDAPALDKVLPGASEHGLLVRPLEQFVNRWAQLLGQARAHPQRLEHVTVIGADAMAVELALAVQQGLKAAQLESHVKLLTHGQAVLTGYPKSVRQRMLAHLSANGLDVLEAKCQTIHADRVTLEGGYSLPSSLTLVAVGGTSPQWLQHSGLDQDQRGNVLVNPFLQSNSHKRVFVVGDLAARADLPGQPQPVTAGRTGTRLALNLLALLSDQPMTVHALSSTGVRRVRCDADLGLASWAGLCAQGTWVQRWRDRADAAFLARFRRQ